MSLSVFWELLSIWYTIIVPVYAIVLTSFYDENKKGEKEMSHLYNIKVGGGNQMQPYVPAGNGDKSGEYTNKSNGVFDKY